MEFDLTKYLKIYPMLDADLCRRTLKQLDEAAWHQHSYTDSNAGYQEVRYENEFLTSNHVFEEQNQIMQAIWNAYSAYCNELNFAWLGGWVGFSQVRFNKYDVNTLMREHCDHINSLFDGERKGIPTMTALGALNDDYEGGELIFWQDRQVVIPPGHIAVFPSNFLYPHKVNPVTKGVRYSFVAWAW